MMRRLWLKSSTARSIIAAQSRSIVIPPQKKAYGKGNFLPHAIRAVKAEQNRILVCPKTLVKGTGRIAVDSFNDMYLPFAVKEALVECGVDVPSPIQQVAIDKIQQNPETNFMVASPSGSGKTIAFLAPTYAKMMKDRDVYGIPIRERRPRTIILTTSHELVLQLHNVCKKFDAATGFRSVALTTARRRFNTTKYLLNKYMPDVIIMHPTSLIKMLRAKRLFIEDLRTVIVDEADALMSSEHDHDGTKFFAFVRHRSLYRHLWPVKSQLLMVTSMVTPPLANYAQRTFNAEMIKTPDLHSPPPTVSQQFFHVEKEAHRMDLLHYILEWKLHHRSSASDPVALNFPSSTTGSASPSPITSTKDTNTKSIIKWEHLRAVAAPATLHIPRTINSPGDRTIIFFRTVPQCTAIYHLLHQSGFQVALVHGNLSLEGRNEQFKQWASGQCNILCATDLAARGLDAEVDAVINFDMPMDAVSYLTRVGRCGRMGQSGRVYSLYTKRQRVIVGAIQSFTAHRLPFNQLSNVHFMMTNPSFSEWRRNRRNLLARKYVQLISSKALPWYTEKTYLRHNATYRMLYRPKSISFHQHAGVPLKDQEKMMDVVTTAAIWTRREVLAKRKGGRAKFGRVQGPVNLDAVGGGGIASGQLESDGTMQPPE